MKTKEVKETLKLGLMVAGGIVLFVICTFFIGSEHNLFSRTFSVIAIFKNVEGLKEGDNVWLSGVKIGTVKEVRIISEGKVAVTMYLKDKQNEFIRKNATAFVGSDGLVGNKIVVIRPGDAAASVNDYDTINAQSPTDTQDLINIAKQVGDNTISITADLKEISRDVSLGRGLVGDLLKNGTFSRSLRQTATDLEETGKHMNKASAEFESIIAAMNNGQGLLNRIVTDTVMAGNLARAVENVSQASANISRVSQNLQEVSAKINNKENALGVILEDKEFKQHLTNTMSNFDSASVKLNLDLEALQHNFLLRGYFKKKARKEK